MTSPSRRAPWWADIVILIGAAYACARLRGLWVGKDLPQGLEALARRSWGNDVVSLATAGLLVLHHVETPERRWSATRIAVYVVATGIAAYPAIEELALRGGALAAMVRILPVALFAGLTYVGSKIRDGLVRRRAERRP